MRRRAAGFTLVEVLLATVLLAAGLTLAFATLGGATASVRRGEAVSTANERIRAVEGFLRRRLVNARGVPFGQDEASGLPVRFEGEADRMRFVSDLPDYIGRGGPHVHELYLEPAPGGRALRLVLALSVAQPPDATGAVPEATPVVEVLADDLREASFRYRGLAPEGGIGEWQPDWETTEQLPVLVEIRLLGADGREWPRLVVAPRLAAAYAGGAAL